MNRRYSNPSLIERLERRELFSAGGTYGVSSPVALVADLHVRLDHAAMRSYLPGDILGTYSGQLVSNTLLGVLDTLWQITGASRNILSGTVSINTGTGLIVQAGFSAHVSRSLHFGFTLRRGNTRIHFKGQISSYIGGEELVGTCTGKIGGYHMHPFGAFGVVPGGDNFLNQ